jgi:hypothetical protein
LRLLYHPAGRKYKVDIRTSGVEETESKVGSGQNKRKNKSISCGGFAIESLLKQKKEKEKSTRKEKCRRE